jgi:hypothetical protein
VIGWKKLLAYMTGSVDQELLLRNEHLVTENRVLRQQITGRVHLTDGERKTLAAIGGESGRWRRWPLARRTWALTQPPSGPRAGPQPVPLPPISFSCRPAHRDQVCHGQRRGAAMQCPNARFCFTVGQRHALVLAQVPAPGLHEQGFDIAVRIGSVMEQRRTNSATGPRPAPCASTTPDGPLH